MNNNISFTGIKNIAAVQFKRDGNVARSISMVLTDDYRGNDLDDFKDAASRSSYNRTGFRNPNGSNILNIECVKREADINDIYVNGQVLNVNDENLPLFTFIGKITKKINNMPDNKFIVNESYKELDADDVLITGEKISKSTGKNVNYDYFFRTDRVKKFARYVNNFVNEMMFEYFEI